MFVFMVLFFILVVVSIASLVLLFRLKSFLFSVLLELRSKDNA